jgi:hypothetical protein
VNHCRRTFVRRRFSAALALLVICTFAVVHRDGTSTVAAQKPGSSQATIQEADGVTRVITSRDLDRLLPPVIESFHAVLSNRFDPQNARALVAFMDRYWRLAGNSGFNASLDEIRRQLVQGGFESATDMRQNVDEARVWVEEYPNEGHGWDHAEARVTMIGGDGVPDEVLLSRERHRVTLAINSFSTPVGGFVGPVVDVGGGTRAADYEGKDVSGTVVVGDGQIGEIWKQAVLERGAAGVISTEIDPFVSPDAPGAAPTPRETWDIVQWGEIPHDASRRSFGFKASPRAAARLRERLGAGLVTVRVDIQSTFAPGPNRTLVAEIPGRSRSHERIVVVAHAQEPGANDNASGCGTLLEIARTLRRAIRAGELPPPARTLTFLWLDEMRGSRQWLASHPDLARGVQAVFSLDMTGQDTSKTGGTFLIEKAPDPSAVWERLSDPHTAWWNGEPYTGPMRGTLLNDLHYAMCLRRGRSTGWDVRVNPYEGGSDHTIFLDAGIPAVLDWHFTDRYYHTNLDRLDKTSGGEIMNVGVAVGATALLMATATQDDAIAVARLVGAAGELRLDLEVRQSTQVLLKATDKASAEAEAREIFSAWQAWYVEAVESVARLPVAGTTNALADAIAKAVAGVKGREFQLKSDTRRGPSR